MSFVLAAAAPSGTTPVTAPTPLSAKSPCRTSPGGMSPAAGTESMREYGTSICTAATLASSPPSSKSRATAAGPGANVPSSGALTRSALWSAATAATEKTPGPVGLTNAASGGKVPGAAVSSMPPAAALAGSAAARS